MARGRERYVMCRRENKEGRFDRCRMDRRHSFREEGCGVCALVEW